MKYIRVETYSKEQKKTYGGFFSAIVTIFALKLGVPPTFSVSELERLVSESDDSSLKEFMSVLSDISSLPYPEVYIQDKENNVCLYQLVEFKRCFDELLYISSTLSDETDGKICLVFREFELPEMELLYSDDFQVVVSKNTYEKYSDQLEYTALPDMP